jgi:hypothetical protein
LCRLGKPTISDFVTVAWKIRPPPSANNNSISMPPLNKFKRFDVRDLLRNGIEPFPEIFQRVNALKPEEGLIVVAPFLPSPLIEKLGSEGFASKVERGSGSDWLVYFWRDPV